MSKFWRCSGFARNQASLGGFLLFLFTLSGCGGGGGGGETTFNAPASVPGATSAHSALSSNSSMAFRVTSSLGTSSSGTSQAFSAVSSSQSVSSSDDVTVSSSIVALSTSSAVSSSLSSPSLSSSLPSAASLSSKLSSASLISSSVVSSLASSVSSVVSVSSSVSSSYSQLSSSSSAAAIVLPIEIIGQPGLVESTQVRVSGTVANGAYVWLKTHRLTWREDGEFATTDNPRNAVHPGTKGSIRLNGGPWLGLSNATVSCETHEAEFGCLNGSYMTVRIKVPLSSLGNPGVKVGDNLLEFRFDATDGISSGWRVLGVDVRNPGGASLIADSVVWDNPDTWIPPLNTSGDIAAGKYLWESAPLTDLGFDNTLHNINAKCSSCHFRDGRDLAYFNYSNKSIIARAEFHGLSNLQARQVASYIRSLDLKLPNGFSRKDAGRPWNPPYQPGLGLDAKPVELWAAGAGVDAVLERDSDMRNYMFPSGVYSPSRMGASGNLNPREMPQAFQYPDWNAWIPTIGIEDLVSDPSLLPGSQPLARLRAAIASLDNYTASNNTADLSQVFWDVKQFMESINGTGFPTAYFYTDRDHPTNPPASHELKVKQARLNLAHHAWYNMRMFELMNKYKIQDKTSYSNAPGSPEVPAGYRSWGLAGRTLFETAPHFVADHPGLTFNFTQPGNYLSTAWYALEQIVNGGFKAGSLGIDWNYHPGHIANVTKGATGFYTDGPDQTYRMAWALIWMYQSVPVNDWRVDPVTQWTPHTFGFSQRQFGLGLEKVGQARGQITHTERAQLQEAQVLAFLGVAERYRPDQWVRRIADDEAHRSADNFETMDYVAHYVPNHIDGWCEWGYQADCYYERIKNLKDSGLLTQETMNRLVDWAAGVWPKGEWNVLRP